MFRRKDPGLSEANLLEIRPIRTADWSADEERVTVERGVPKFRGIRGLFKRLSFLTGVKKLRLDALGTAVWTRLDGARTVAQVVEELREEFGETCEPAEERLGMFLGLLRRETLIGYPGWDDERITDWQSTAAEAATKPSPQ